MRDRVERQRDSSDATYPLPAAAFFCLFGEGARARSVVAEASGMAQKIVARTSFEATRDLARSDNTALLGAAPLP